MYFQTPIEVRIGERFAYTNNGRHQTRKVIYDKFWYIPLIESLKQLLESPSIQRLVLRYPLFASEGYMCNLFGVSGTIIFNKMCYLIIGKKKIDIQNHWLEDCV